MILGESRQTAGSAATLDDLFRRAGVRHPDASALVDPPNREEFAARAPRTLTFAEADRAISALAVMLRELGLQTDAPVAMQLPNTVESLITFLAILRAGMIAVPIPLLWRQQEIVAALGCVGAKAIVTAAGVRSHSYANIAMRAAVDLFQIRHVCAFGSNLPDGVTPLDGVFTRGDDDLTPTFPRPGVAAAHVAAVTFDLDASGLVPIARSHVELVAGGLETFLEMDGSPDRSLLSTVPVGSFAGIALTALPWLLTGGTLHLHHSFNPKAFAAQLRDLANGAVILPAAAVVPIADAGLLGDNIQTVVALWRSPERLSAAKAWQHPAAVIDVACFGEAGLVAARRGANGLPVQIPYGAVDVTRRPIGAPTVIQATRTLGGTLALRGRMVPTHAFLPGERNPRSRLTSDLSGYVDTGFACQIERNGQALTVTASPPGLTIVGGYRFLQSDIDEMVAQADPTATIVALPDVDLGLRLAGSAEHRDALCEKLQASGTNPLIAGAFRPRRGIEAA